MPAVAHADRLAVVRPREQRRVAPCVAEVVLAAGPERRWVLLPVDEELLVTLAPPPVPVAPLDLVAASAARVPDVEHHPAEAATAAGTHHGPIRPAVLANGHHVAVPLGMKLPVRAVRH